METVLAPNQVTNRSEDYKASEYFSPHDQLTQILLISTVNPEYAKAVWIPTLILKREFEIVQKQSRVKNNLTEEATNELLETAFNTAEVKKIIQGTKSKKKIRVFYQLVT